MKTGRTISVPGVDPELLEYLREWRRTAAKEQGVPAFVVMHDTSLEELCRTRPRTIAEVRQVHGFGEHKTQLYGKQIVAALQRFRAGARAAVAAEKKLPPADETIQLLAQGRTFEEIAQIRGRQLSTIVAMVAELVESGELEFQPAWVDAAKQAQIEEVCARLGTAQLRPLKDALPPEISYGEIRLVMARLRRNRGKS